jgi:hypothetical protein
MGKHEFRRLAMKKMRRMGGYEFQRFGEEEDG